MGKLSGCHIQREQSATSRDEAFLGSSLRAMLVTSWNGCILRKNALQLMLLLILPQAFEDLADDMVHLEGSTFFPNHTQMDFNRLGVPLVVQLGIVYTTDLGRRK